MPGETFSSLSVSFICHKALKILGESVVKVRCVSLFFCTIIVPDFFFFALTSSNMQPRGARNAHVFSFKSKCAKDG
jgi:hypothetical protein